MRAMGVYCHKCERRDWQECDPEGVCEDNAGRFDMRPVSQVEWNTARRHDYARVIDGKRFMLMRENGATLLVPVRIV